MPSSPPPRLRSRAWFDNPDNIDMTALYLERYLNFGLSLEELQIGQAHHRHRADRHRTCPPATGITWCWPSGSARASGRPAASPLEFPVHPIQETGKRPTAGLDRNLAYLGLVELLYGYPIDGVVLTIGCDKTTPACLMAAATVNIPAIALSVGPMLNGWHKGERTGSGTIVWKAREMLAAGEIDQRGLHQARRLLGAVHRLLQHHGHGHDHEQPRPRCWACRCRARPPSRRPTATGRKCAYRTGKRIVEMVREDRKPSDILTREAFLNAIASTPPSAARPTRRSICNAIARHMGVELDDR